MLWEEELASNRLLHYEVWVRLNAYGLLASHGDRASARLDRVNFVKLGQRVLARALEPFPIALRTLDALHLATIDFLRQNGEMVELASYDNRLLDAAHAVGVAIAAV